MKTLILIDNKNTLSGKTLRRVTGTVTDDKCAGIGIFTVNYHQSAIEELVQIAIYDATGRLVYNHKFDKSANAFNQTISTEQLPTGLYMLGMELNGETQYQKFIVQ